MSRNVLVALVVASVAMAVALGVLWGARQPSSAMLAVAAYTVPWDEDRGLRSLREHGAALTEISPVWYTPTDDGDVVRNVESDTSQVAAVARSNGLRIIPAISNFRDDRWDAGLIHRIVSDPERATAHIDSIVELIDNRGWDGIDLDYESLRPEDRDDYSSFIRDLGARLDDIGKHLTVTVAAKTSDDGTAGFHQAQDYQAIGEAADEVRVMAYDRHWSGSEPGPIAPVDWVEDVVEYTLSRVPAEKVALGVATYGYDWTAEGGQDLMWSDAMALAERHGAEVQWDAESQAPWFTYTADGEDHTVWFEDARSADAKIALAERSGLRGIFVWKLGGEQPDVWSRVS